MSMALWKTKLAAWLHDPAEKALVLMRDVDNRGQRIGHEEGSVAELRRVLGIAKSDFNYDADCWAAASDRPQWPCEDGKPRPDWANVRFVERPVLIHPLSGEEIDLEKLTEIAAPHIRNASLGHFLDLVETDVEGQPDYFLTLLAFWRFGPEPRLAAPELGELWRLLPADTRVPDHSIWSHLDVVSALAGATAGGSPALLTMSFGPVQGFIAQARSTSDLWAGSHLLSSLVWEGLKVVCGELGPDAVLFPHLRGVAAVDRWLLSVVPESRREAWRRRFRDIDVEWLDSVSDANPLFAATLPNKFMALVPAARASELAKKVTDAVRAKALEWTLQAAYKVFDKAGRDTGESAHWRQQVAQQLQGFPEAHWSVADWPTATDSDGFPRTEALEQAMAAFQPADRQDFFSGPLWGLMAGTEVVEHQGRKRTWKALRLPGGEEFFVPNPGLLYPAVHELAERCLATAKTLRAFDTLAQAGYRCTLTGEQEWLTDDDDLFKQPHSVQKERSVWAGLVGQFGIKEGEHLGALACLKRLWPTLFVEQVAEFLEEKPSRFMVSTHTMALANDLEELDAKLAAPDARARIEVVLADADRAPALPRSLSRLRKSTAARIPAALDRLRDAGDDERLRLLEGEVDRLLGHRPETYYALIQMDGDRMGAWMAGNEPDFQLPFSKTWHEQVRTTVANRFGANEAIRSYMNAPRPASPARHAAISRVLNDFSTHVARHIVEEVFKGKLLYAGGDDVLAMVSVDDLLPAMLLLRAAYSGMGETPGLPTGLDLKGLRLKRGYVQLKERLMPMMGSRASASIGAIVAHHKAPLVMVLRELRQAEGRAKKEGGRNAFSLRILKQAGGEVGVTDKWFRGDGDSAAGLLDGLMRLLARDGVSRRAAYNSVEWLAQLPEKPDVELLRANLAYQFARQAKGEELKERMKVLAFELADYVSRHHSGSAAKTMMDFLMTAEFLARNSRHSEVTQ